MTLSSNRIYKVANVINNNIVTVTDFNGREMIAIGKGLGFRKKKKDYVYPDEIMKTYIYIDKHKPNMFSLFEEVPFEVIEVSQKIIDYATYTLSQKFNVNLLVSLADHINFSIFEYKKGNTMPKLVNEEVKRFYKDEYQIGLFGVKLINDTFDIKLEKDEATSIAFHLITATEQKSNSETKELMKGVASIVNIVEHSLSCHLDEDSLAYSRFIIHLKFFLRSIITKQTNNNVSEITSIFSDLKTKYADVEKCIAEIKNFISESYKYICSDADCIYLMIHIVRLKEITRKD